MIFGSTEPLESYCAHLLLSKDEIYFGILSAKGSRTVYSPRPTSQVGFSSLPIYYDDLGFVEEELLKIIVFVRFTGILFDRIPCFKCLLLAVVLSKH